QEQHELVDDQHLTHGRLPLHEAVPVRVRERNVPSAALTSSACVQSNPWGAPSISTYCASGSSVRKRRAVASMGRMSSAVPCRIKAGMPLALTASTSVRKSSIQEETTAWAATGALEAATFQLL